MKTALLSTTCLVASAILGVAPVMAQEAEPAAQNQVEGVVVTASRIVRDGYEAPTPTTVVGAADIQKQSVANIANYVNQLPQLGAGAGASPRTNSFIPTNLGGGNAFNMRNLTTVRTLTLLDGHRVVGANTQQIVDINMLPTNLVARVDVVTGGASAAWGSDAVAGIVNFVLDKTFTGFKGNVGYGTSWRGDAANFNADLAAGLKFAGGRGHLLLSGRFEREDGVLSNASRDWYTGYKAVPNANRTATNGLPGFIAADHAGLRLATSGGVITTGPLAGVQFGPGGTVLPYRAATAGAGIIGVGGDVEDIGGQYMITPDFKNASLFARANFDLTDDVQLYAELGQGWSKGHSLTSHYIRHSDLTIFADNPFIPAALNLQGQTSFRLGRVMNEPGTGPGDIRTDRRQTRGVIGVDGRTDWFDSSFKWNAYYQHGETRQHLNLSHNAVTARFNNAADVVRNPATGGVAGIAAGVPVCRSLIPSAANGFSPVQDGCQPLNLFGAGSPSKAALDYIYYTTAWQTAKIRQDVAAVGFQFEPFSLPAGAVSIAGGAEYRREGYSEVVDPLDAEATKTNTIAFGLGNYRAGGGKFNVKEAFGEVVVPVIKDAPLIKSLDFNGALRVTDYSTSGRVETWKLGGTWDVNGDLRFRGTRSRDIRAPNLNDLFAAGSTNGIGIQVPNSSAQVLINASASGNKNLTPEIASTTSFGLVYRPSFVPGFSASVDRYKISIKNAIITTAAQQAINLCYGVGYVVTPSACAAILLAPGPDLATQLSRPATVLLGPLNVASQDVAGYDFEFGYRRDLSYFSENLPGSLDLRAVGSFTTKFTQTAGGVTQNFRDMVFSGAFPIAGGPNWRWLVTGSYSLGPSTTTLTMRYIGKAVINNEPMGSSLSVLQNKIRPVEYLDLNQSWNLNIRGADSQIYAKIENVFDTDPPRVASTQGTAYAASGTDGSYYDLIGRTWRVGIRFKY